MESKKQNDNIVLSFNNDEALVLLEWLTRFNESEIPSLFEDQAEERVLFDLESILEESVSGTLKGDYKEILEKARNKIRDEE
ncbi:hypothetical protein [Pontimicrobium sp. MEBiC06410]